MAIRRHLLSATLALSIAFVGQANAYSWSDYLRFNGEPMSLALLTTMGQSYMFADIESQKLGAPPLYCAPSNLALTGEQYQSILERFVNANPISNSEVPVELVMLRALQDTFPC